MVYEGLSHERSDVIARRIALTEDLAMNMIVTAIAPCAAIASETDPIPQGDS
jgi:hypothetical protein